ncbi:MAG: cytidine deaminase [Clostridia bacterium]
MLTDRVLFDRACAALARAYAPYSHFRVGACLLAEDGRAFEGCNIENASYGATICAERCAISGAVVQGATRFAAIAVVGEHADAWPCGICRQVLNEFSPAMRVVCGSVDSGKFVVTTLDRLLPHAFGPENLQNTQTQPRQAPAMTEEDT